MLEFLEALDGFLNHDDIVGVVLLGLDEDDGPEGRLIGLDGAGHGMGDELPAPGIDIVPHL